MPAFKDLTGEQFGKLTVIRRIPKTEIKRTAAYWEVQCDCGSPPKSVLGTSLTSGHTKSCGCLREQSRSPQPTKPNQGKTKQWSIRMPAEVAVKLEAIAHSQNLTPHAFVLRLIKEAIANDH